MHAEAFGVEKTREKNALIYVRMYVRTYKNEAYMHLDGSTISTCYVTLGKPR